MARHAVEADCFPRIWGSALVACLVLAAGCSGPPDDGPSSSSDDGLEVGPRHDRRLRARHEGHEDEHRGHSEDGPCGRAGVGGAGGASGGQAGSGGANGGESGNGGTPGSAAVFPLSFDFEGPCNVPDQSLTISNTGGTALTWVAGVVGVPVNVIPPSSTLLPGTSVTVAVSPFFPLRVSTVSGTITINTDGAGVLGPIAVLYNVSGFHVTPPPNIDFGVVPLGSQKRISFPAPPASPPGAILISSNPDFMLTGLAPGDPSPGFWTLIFTPRVVGVQSTTLTLGSMFVTVCPPNTFTAAGVGVPP